MLIKIKLLKGGRMPEKATPGAAAFDCYVRETMLINGEPAKVPLGFALELPEGWRAKIYPRSSIGLKTKLRMANSVGIIDSDYRGEVCAIFESILPSPFGGVAPIRIFEGQRIAQMIIEKDEDIELETTEELSETERGEGGFGSTGR